MFHGYCCYDFISMLLHTAHTGFLSNETEKSMEKSTN